MRTPDKARTQRGLSAWHAGAAAEKAVERRYVDEGFALVARRWRKGGGEIDLILRDGPGIVFVEVKKSRDFETAATRILPHQIARIHTGAEVFLADEPKGELTPCRFDVALVNDVGEIRILENAF